MNKLHEVHDVKIEIGISNMIWKNQSWKIIIQCQPNVDHENIDLLSIQL